MALAYSPDGARVVTASKDATARVWDAASHTLVSTLRGHRSAINTIAFSPDGARLVTASDDATATVWNPETGERVTDLTDRIGLRGPDGAIQWPIPPRVLARVGCRRLKPFEDDYPEAAAVCDRLLDPGT